MESETTRNCCLARCNHKLFLLNAVGFTGCKQESAKEMEAEWSTATALKITFVLLRWEPKALHKTKSEIFRL